MNLLFIAAIYIGAGGPFSSAIQLSKPNVAEPKWSTIKVDSTTVELPVPIIKSYERVAPSNYNVPVPTKRVAVPCPYHGYRCGMQKSVEDLIGHLQTEHNISLEEANSISRDQLQDLHDNLHWQEETKERQELFLNYKPEEAKPVQKSGCANGNCPTSNYSSRRLFR